MSIVKMRRVQILGIASELDSLLNRFLSMGCVEISKSEVEEEELKSVLLPVSESYLDDFKAKNQLLTRALALLNTYAPVKSKLFPELRPVKAKSIFDDAYLSKTLESAEAIVALKAQIDGIDSTAATLRMKSAMLMPWKSLDIPLETAGTRYTQIMFFTVPGYADTEEMKRAVNEASALAQIDVYGADKEQSYCGLIVHRDDYEAVCDVLRRFGFSVQDFSESNGTADNNITAILYNISNLMTEKEKLKMKLEAYGSERRDIENCIDRTAQEISREEAKERLMEVGSVFSLEGWVPKASEEELKKLLDDTCCAYEFSDPKPEDDVPVKLKNSKLVEPMNMVTELYSLPAYGNVDPNPLIFPWFTLFFGIMYADLGYGLVLLTLGIVGLRLIKQKGTLKYMAGLLVLCGITTSICGILFGSFFGDAIPVFCDLLGIEHHELWSIIDPMEEPMTALIGSVVIGAVHLLLGMAIKAFILIRDGHPLAALFDVGSWWVLFAGLGLGALGKGWTTALVGAGMLIVSQGREKPTLIGKFIGGLASLYDITSYVGDILSYTRLMALMLAGGVIASVVNVLGSMGGSIITFIIVFVIGHLFNMAINIIGTFVHAARLQYLEFFGKFYEEGGKPFKPLRYNTKYTDIVKEEK